MIIKRGAILLAATIILWLSPGCTPERMLSIPEFTNALTSKGVIIEENTPMIAQLISAREGAGLRIAGTSVEVYEFDTSIKSGKDALAKYASEGLMGQRAISHKNLLLLENTKNERWKTIKQVFESL